MGIPADQIMALTQRCAQAEVDRDKARARVAELSRAYAVQGLAIEELTDERDRYREALTTLEVQAVPEIAPDWVGIPTVEFDAAMRILKEPTK